MTTKGSILDKLRYAFFLYDLDDNGFIDKYELKIVLNAMKLFLGENNLQGNLNEIFTHLDTSKDELISKGI